MHFVDNVRYVFELQDQDNRIMAGERKQDWEYVPVPLLNMSSHFIATTVMQLAVVKSQRVINILYWRLLRIIT